MRIGSENRPSWIQRKHWERFGEAIAIKPRLVLKTLQDMTTAIMPVAEGLAEEFRQAYGKSTIIDKIMAVIRKRAETV
jgi:serine/threonine-protein kinase HipA